MAANISLHTIFAPSHPVDALHYTMLWFWLHAGVVVLLFLGGFLVDRQLNRVPDQDLLVLQLKAYLLATPLSIAGAFPLLGVGLLSPLLWQVYLSTFALLLLMISCYYKAQLSDLGQDGDYLPAWRLKLGLLLIVGTGGWLWFGG